MQGEQAQGREQELGKILISEGRCLPEIIAAFEHCLEDQLERAKSNLPAHKKTQKRPNL